MQILFAPDRRLVDDLIKEFLSESREDLDRMDVCLTALEAHPADKDLLGEIFRAVHTMKGATGFLGYPRLERLTHTGETLLSLLRDGALVADARVIDVLFRLMDRLREVIELIERLGREGERSSDDDSAILADLENLHQPVAHSAPDFLDMMAQAGLAAPETADWPGPEAAQPGQDTVENRQEAPVHAATSGNAPRPVSPVQPAAQSGESGAKVALKSRHEGDGVRDAESTVRVDVQVLDRMVHLVGELVLTRNQLQKKRTEENGGLEAAERLNSLTQELRQTVMQARMLPLAQLFQRFPRMVRDLAKTCSKSVRIEFSGQDTALDRSLIESIKDPLTHTLRNAIDHGIEAACERFTAGKPAEGLVRLCARQQSGWVIIEVSDDGAGIARERLIARATERELITAEQAATMSDREVMELIFEPGFSTAAAVTNISGRGVGMDVVRSQVEHVGGSVEIESERGVGTVVRLRVPLTLAIVPAWTVRVGEHSFCIPQNALAELACVHYRDVNSLCSQVHEAQVYRLRDELLPMVSLDDVLGMPRQRGPLGFYVAIVDVDDVRFALIVDDVVAAEEIVVKPVSSVVRDLGVYSGATVLGDGEVAMVLDMPAIAHRAGMRNQVRHGRAAVRIAAAAEPTVVLAEMDGADGSVQRTAFPVETVERIELVARTSLERIQGRWMLNYRGEVLWVEDPASLLERSSEAGELTLLICPDRQSPRRAVLVSRVIEVATTGTASSDPALPQAEIALLGDRLTLMRATENVGVAARQRWQEVA